MFFYYFFIQKKKKGDTNTKKEIKCFFAELKNLMFGENFFCLFVLEENPQTSN